MTDGCTLIGTRPLREAECGCCDHRIALLLVCVRCSLLGPGPADSAAGRLRRHAGLHLYDAARAAGPPQPDGQTLDLAVAAADNVDAPRGVLLMLTGGPGQPGVSLLARVRTYLDPAVLREYRLVMFDQRGTGSTGIDCPELQTAVGGSDFLTAARARPSQACASETRLQPRLLRHTRHGRGHRASCASPSGRTS